MIEVTIERWPLETFLTPYDRDAGEGPEENWGQLWRLRRAHVVAARDVTTGELTIVAGTEHDAAIERGQPCPDPAGWRLVHVLIDDDDGSPDCLRLLALLIAIRERGPTPWRGGLYQLAAPPDAD